MDEETLEEAAKKRVPTSSSVWDLTETRRNDFIAGAKWQQERSYSEEDLKEAFKQSRQVFIYQKDMPPLFENFEQWFEQFKKK
jgi:hypothetical protein